MTSTEPERANITSPEDEPYVSIRLVKRLSYNPSVPVSEIRRIVKKVVSERRAAEKAGKHEI